MMWRGRPTWAEIDLDAIEANVHALRRRVPAAAVLAAVKANAYGHGAVPVAQAVLRAGAARLGVACVDEGIELRQAGLLAPILVLGYVPPWEAEAAVAHDLTVTANTKQTALALAAAARRSGRTVPVHVKVDTGMARFGLPPADVAPFVGFLLTLSNVHVEGLYTHFATADELDRTFMEEQYRRFRAVADALPRLPVCHVANSAAVIDAPELALDMVRPGISVYGVYPSAQTGRAVQLRPALTLKSRVARLRWLDAGESVSYGRTWVAERPARIALVPCGYGDGLRRSLSNRGSVLIGGRRASIRGRVCMDQCVVDVTDLPDVRLDDEVVLIGRQGDAEVSATEVAEQAGTIAYEIFTGLTPRVPRVYLQGGEVLDIRSLTGSSADLAGPGAGLTPETLRRVSRGGSRE
ncbi:MAG: alanine racemase [Chloroflexi bacterium]|nr:alanine racemase [Chloroflexota bacterium]